MTRHQEGLEPHMGLALGITGIAVIGVGVVLVAVGTLLAWQEEQRRRAALPPSRGLGDVLQGLAALCDALARHPLGIRLIVLGVVLTVVGGGIAGAGGLTAS